MRDESDLPDDDERLGDEFPEGEAHGRAGLFSGLLFGALLGAGVALLLAPEKGDVTRRRMRRRLGKLTDDARSRVDDWTEDARKKLRRQRRRLKRRLQGR